MDVRGRILVAGVALAAAAVAAAAEEAAAGARLMALEARVPQENQFPNVRPEFQQDVARLVDTNLLSSPDDFLRAAGLANDPFRHYRSTRVRYELLLAAAALGSRPAAAQLAEAWDALLGSLGRPWRFDFAGVVAARPDLGYLTLDPTPRSVRDVMRDPAAAVAAAAKAVDNPEVQRLFDADQGARQDFGKMTEDDMKNIAAADAVRHRRIREIIEAGGLHTAKDFAHAAMVLQHSPNFAGFELAHELAVCSTLLGDREVGRWLVAASYDRMLESVGHDQRFGTQGEVTATPAEKPRLALVDESGICDAERLALGCPTLAAKRADFYAEHPK